MAFCFPAADVWDQFLALAALSWEPPSTESGYGKGGMVPQGGGDRTEVFRLCTELLLSTAVAI